MQILRRDPTPIRRGPEVLKDDRNNPMHAPDEDRFGRQSELVDLVLGGGSIVGLGALAIAPAMVVALGEPAAPRHRIPADRPPHQLERKPRLDRIRAVAG